jgi:predicted dithiol-disulfide oxidoreductase (DUF899 family)
MTVHKIVSNEEWLTARKALLAKEKEFSRLRDELSQRRRDLPWRRVEKEYVFEGPDGRESLVGLFGGRSQLIIYHFMFDPEWNEGCKSCSFIADHYNPAGKCVAVRPRRCTLAPANGASATRGGA